MEKAMTLIARIFGAILSLFLLGIIIIIGGGSLFPDNSEISGNFDPMSLYFEIIPVLILVIFAIIAYIYAFRHPTNPKWGFFIIGIGVLIFLDIVLTRWIRFSASSETFRTGFMAGAIYIIPLSIEGILFIVAAYLSRKSK